jgi:cobalt-zinc-cadmium efflux system protein
VTVLLCFISSTLVVESVESLLIPSEDEPDDPLVLVLAGASFVVNTSAAVHFGSINCRTWVINAEGASMSILSDLISSAAVVITSWIRLEWGIEWLDPFMSLLISAMIFMITAREMHPMVRILLQEAPNWVRVAEILRSVAPEDHQAKGRAWILDERKAIVTMAFSPMQREQWEGMIEKIEEAVGDTEWTAELPVR